jgi:type VI secretion system protein ImpC
MSDLAVQTTSSVDGMSLLDRIVTEGRMALSDSQKPHARDLLAEFVDQVLTPGDTMAGDVVEAIKARIAAIDELVTSQLNHVMHNPEFQTLEASWRGLNYLVKKTETGTNLKLRLLNISRDEIQKDLEKAVEFDQSALFKKVYEDEYGTFGGMPYSALIGDYYFGRHPQDIALLEMISNVAAAAHAPFIAGASPLMFDMTSFTTIGEPRDIAKVFESTEMVKWRDFRKSEDSRYAALVLPRVLLRLPYGAATNPVAGVSFEEEVDGTDHSKYLWGNAVWALAERMTAAFAQFSWCTAIRGVEGGGKVEGLPTHTYHTADGEVVLKCPTEVAITDRREKELSDMGFISLVHCKNTGYAAFFGAQTANVPASYDTPEANSNARLSSVLTYMLAASRFAHYLKVMIRDKIGSFQDKTAIEGYLNRWLGNYILLMDDASQEGKSRFPLREGRVDVYEVAGRPGSYRATVYLRPHFQLEELTTSIRLVAELPASVA